MPLLQEFLHAVGAALVVVEDGGEGEAGGEVG